MLKCLLVYISSIWFRGIQKKLIQKNSSWRLDTVQICLWIWFFLCNFSGLQSPDTPYCILHISYSSKTSRPIRIQDFLNYNISQMNWGLKVDFCVWLDIHRSNKFIQVISKGCDQTSLGIPKVMRHFMNNWI